MMIPKKSQHGQTLFCHKGTDNLEPYSSFSQPLEPKEGIDYSEPIESE